MKVDKGITATKDISSGEGIFPFARSEFKFAFLDNLILQLIRNIC